MRITRSVLAFFGVATGQYTPVDTRRRPLFHTTVRFQVSGRPTPINAIVLGTGRRRSTCSTASTVTPRSRSLADAARARSPARTRRRSPARTSPRTASTTTSPSTARPSTRRRPRPRSRTRSRSAGPRSGKARGARLAELRLTRLDDHPTDGPVRGHDDPAMRERRIPNLRSASLHGSSLRRRPLYWYLPGGMPRLWTRSDHLTDPLAKQQAQADTTYLLDVGREQHLQPTQGGFLAGGRPTPPTTGTRVEAVPVASGPDCTVRWLLLDAVGRTHPDEPFHRPALRRHGTRGPLYRAAARPPSIRSLSSRSRIALTSSTNRASGVISTPTWSTQTSCSERVERCLSHIRKGVVAAIRRGATGRKARWRTFRRSSSALVPLGTVRLSSRIRAIV